jgi:hypothetical protein
VLVAVGREGSFPGRGGREGIIDALSVLSRVRRGEPFRTPGKLVAVGGGDTAIDVARTAIRLGAEDASIACPESREVMHASDWAVEDAIAEGVGILPSTAVKKFLYRRGNCGFGAPAERIDVDEKGGIVPARFRERVRGPRRHDRSDRHPGRARLLPTRNPEAPGPFPACLSVDFPEKEIEFPPMRAGIACAGPVRSWRLPHPAGRLH